MSLTDPNVLSLICVVCGSILGWVIKHHLGASTDLFGKKPATTPPVAPPAAPAPLPLSPSPVVQSLPNDVPIEAVLAVQRFLDRKKAEAHDELKKLLPS